MAIIKGIDIKIIVKTETGRDPFGAPIVTEKAKTVKNVLVNSISTTDILNTVNLTGKTAVYELCIPKGDKTHWENAEVEFYGERWQTIGIPEQWIEEMVPLDWNRKIKVARYE